MTWGFERVVYVCESVLEIREHNSWVYVDGEYRGSGIHIKAVQDQHGQQFAPLLEAEWSVVTEGIITRCQEGLMDNYTHELRVDTMYLPVRILYRSWCQRVLPQSGQEESSESRYWVRYVRE